MFLPFSLPAPVVVTNIQVVSYLVLPVSKYYQYVVLVYLVALTYSSRAVGTYS